MNTFDQIKQAAFQDELQKIAAPWGEIASGAMQVGKTALNTLKGSFGNLGKGLARTGEAGVIARTPGLSEHAPAMAQQALNNFKNSKAAIGTIGAGVLGASAVAKSAFGGDRR